MCVSVCASYLNFFLWIHSFAFLLFFPVSFLLFPDVFQSEMWCEFLVSIPDHLQPMATRVKETILASKAEGTIRSYLARFKRWKLWASSNYLCHMPTNSFHVAVYLQCLILDANSPSPIFNAVYSIEWAQQLAGLPKISGHPMVSSIVAASQRILGNLSRRKSPSLLKC